MSTSLFSADALSTFSSVSFWISTVGKPPLLLTSVPYPPLFWLILFFHLSLSHTNSPSPSGQSTKKNLGQKTKDDRDILISYFHLCVTLPLCSFYSTILWWLWFKFLNSTLASGQESCVCFMNGFKCLNLTTYSVFTKHFHLISN